MWRADGNFKIDLIVSSHVSLFVSESFPMAFRVLPKIRCDEVLLGFKV